jgi:uncharacterized membrane protein
MSDAGHLWAIGYDSMDRAERLRAEVARLAETHCLALLDTAVVVRYPDGSVTLNGEPFVCVPAFRGHTLLGFLAGLSLGAPALTGAAAGAWMSAAGGTAVRAGIEETFIRDVQALMKPGTSALFVLDQASDMTSILNRIRGLGGTILKTNVDLERARLIQSALTGDTPEARNL